MSYRLVSLDSSLHCSLYKPPLRSLEYRSYEAAGKIAAESAPCFYAESACCHNSMPRLSIACVTHLCHVMPSAPCFNVSAFGAHLMDTDPKPGPPKQKKCEVHTASQMNTEHKGTYSECEGAVGSLCRPCHLFRGTVQLQQNEEITCRPKLQTLNDPKPSALYPTPETRILYLGKTLKAIRVVPKIRAHFGTPKYLVLSHNL